MGVDYLKNFDCGDRIPIEAAIGFAWHGIVVWLEEQPIRMHEIERQLPRPVPLEFVASPGEEAELAEVGRRA